MKKLSGMVMEVRGTDWDLVMNAPIMQLDYRRGVVDLLAPSAKPPTEKQPKRPELNTEDLDL